MKNVQFTITPIDFYGEVNELISEVVIQIDFENDVASYIANRKNRISPPQEMDMKQAMDLFKKGLSKREVIPSLYGATEFAEMIGWKLGKMSVYDMRGKLPSPALVIGNRSFWTFEQVERYRNQLVLNIK